MYPLLLFFSLTFAGLQPAATSDNCQGELRNNLRHGHWKCFYNNGTLLQEGDYTAGKKEGFWKLFHVNGILAGEGAYVNDQEKGMWKFYDDAGKLILEQEY